MAHVLEWRLKQKSTVCLRDRINIFYYTPSVDALAEMPYAEQTVDAGGRVQGKNDYIEFKVNIIT